MVSSPFIAPKIQQKIDANLREIKAKIKHQSPEAKKAATDFIEFRKYVCGQDTFPHMMRWHQELNTGQSNQYLKGIAGDDTCILAPRNSAKSTFLLQWVAWVIGTHVSQGINLKILYISYVVDVAASKSRQIKNIIESDRYQEVFPKVRKSRSKWGEKEWAIDFKFAGLRNIDESYTVACSGLSGAINSKRAHLLICDDLLKSRSDAINKSIQDRMIDNWYSVIRFTRYDGSRAINLGTRMSKHDIYAKMFVPPDWRIIAQKALIIENGIEKSFWEQGLSLTLLRKERDDNLETFLLQRQNEIPEHEARGIHPNLIKYSDIPNQCSHLIVGLDLAVSLKKTGDNTAIVCLLIFNKTIYVVDAWQEKIQGSMKKIDLIRDTFEQNRKGNCQPVIAVDSNKFSCDLKGDLGDYINESQDYFRQVWLEEVASTGRGDKLDRIESHSLLFEQNKIFFKRDDTSQTKINDLIEEITNYNDTEHNDLLDALEVALSAGREYINYKDLKFKW